MSQDSKARLFLQKRDLILILALLFCAGLMYLFLSSRPHALQAEIWLDGELVQTVSLTEDLVFSPESCPGVQIEVRDGRIRFLSSDCPDRICVRSGFISRPGEYAVCLPHRLMIRIPGTDPDGSVPDAVTGRRLP